VPPLDTAIWMGERSITAGTMKLHNSCLSTTLTNLLPRSAASATCRFNSSLSVAAMTSTACLMRPSEKLSAMRQILPSSAHVCRFSVSSCAASKTVAPASSSDWILRSATVPPPTTKTGRPRRSANMGK
jgi:hypothetical protein